MSGIEVVGLIIGIIPLLVTTIDQCQQGYEFVDERIHFAREFSEFSRIVKCQRFLLQQLIKRTLVSVTESEETSARMLGNPGCDDWRDPAITEKLKNKLPGDEEYETYCKLLQSIHRQLEKVTSGLQKYSGLEPALSSTPDVGTRVRNELRKLQFCFQKKRLMDRVTLMSQQIHSLERFLGNAEILQQSRQHYTRNNIVALFERVRRQATSLHRAITRSWICDCRDSHAFKLIISRPSRPSHSGQDNTTSEEKHLRIALPCGSGGQGHMLTPQSASNTARWCIAEAALATSFEPHVSVWSQLISSETASTQMLLTVPPGNQGRRIADNGNSSTLLVLPQPSIVLSSADSPYHHEPLTLAPDSTHIIQDMCSMLKFQRTTSQLGCLFDGSGSYHALTVVSTGTSSPEIVGQAVSLGQILTPTTRGYLALLPERLNIASTIAHSLLELFPSPWFPEIWDKNDIFFFADENQQVNLKMPFLVSRNNRNAVPHAQRSRDHRKALLALGTLILELWVGQPLELQRSWRANFGPDGRETEFTKFNAAAAWQESIAADGGSILHNITQRCIYGNFGLTSLSLEDTELIKAVYENVVVGLQRLCETFS
ncbi:hypothetical protein QBC45DRAFT_423430 [Copromyces sp. CBS 386.78]|nr:hypothetical protein QBC45DRAFT_423430 [Copromyces sp. CBS 386.78]